LQHNIVFVLCGFQLCGCKIAGLTSFVEQQSEVEWYHQHTLSTHHTLKKLLCTLLIWCGKVRDCASKV
jgi:hypothetical protein